MGNIKRILSVIKSNGFKKAAGMFIIKFERIFVNLLTPIFAVLSKFSNSAMSRNHKGILVLLEQRFSVSSQNRAFDLSEYLRMAGFTVSVVSPVKSLFYILIAKKYSLIVFQRNVASTLINNYLQIASANNIKTVYDSDDLVFDPQISTYMNEDAASSANRWRRIAAAHNDVYIKCKFFLTSTNFLAKHAEETGKKDKTFILRNGLNKKYRDTCNIILNKKSGNSNIITIGYMSGTASHNLDFKLVEKPLFNILENYKNVVLKVAGLLSLPEYFFTDKIRGRIKTLPLVKFNKLPFSIADFDINIAPSIIGNPFNEGKSELKYVYAGCLAIPTIASATDAFLAAITNEQNGFLCSSENDWLYYLELLVKNSDVRMKTGQNARKHISQNYMPEEMSLKAGTIFNNILNNAD